jgi:hypothetical protein
MTVPGRIELTREQADALLMRVKTNRLEQGDYELIKAIIDTLTLLGQAYEEKTTSIKRLLRMIFGARTEKTKNILGADDDPKACQGNPDGSDKQDDVCEDDKKDGPKNKPKGHGRNGVNAYTGAEKIFIPCTKLKHGAPCPLCTGKVYKMKVPGVIVGIFGRASVPAKVWKYEKLRCNLCGEIFEPIRIWHAVL